MSKDQGAKLGITEYKYITSSHLKTNNHKIGIQSLWVINECENRVGFDQMGSGHWTIILQDIGHVHHKILKITDAAKGVRERFFVDSADSIV